MSLGPSPAQLAAMRAQFTAALLDTCTLNGTTGSGSGRGFANIANNVPCFFDQASGGGGPSLQEIDMGQVQPNFYVRYDQVLQKGWQVVHNGHTYTIKA